jgi:hypothetical protein
MNLPFFNTVLLFESPFKKSLLSPKNHLYEKTPAYFSLFPLFLSR